MPMEIKYSDLSVYKPHCKTNRSTSWVSAFERRLVWSWASVSAGLCTVTGCQQDRLDLGMGIRMSRFIVGMVMVIRRCSTASSTAIAGTI